MPILRFVLIVLPIHNGGLVRQAGLPCPELLSSRTLSKGIVWHRQIDTIKIHAADAITANGQEVYNLLQERGIDNVILIGVHTNRCVLGRPFGIRQMVSLKKNVVLCRDLTDSFHRDPGHHFEGLDQIVSHVEKYWCPTMTSETLTGKPPFRFQQAGAAKEAANERRE